MLVNKLCRCFTADVHVIQTWFLQVFQSDNYVYYDSSFIEIVFKL